MYIYIYIYVDIYIYIYTGDTLEDRAPAGPHGQRRRLLLQGLRAGLSRAHHIVLCIILYYITTLYYGSLNYYISIVSKYPYSIVHQIIAYYIIIYFIIAGPRRRSGDSSYSIVQVCCLGYAKAAQS